MTSAESAPYEALARMIERELELIGTGDDDALAALGSEREALIATLEFANTERVSRTVRGYSAQREPLRHVEATA
jgi:hypothetical protein